MAEQEIPKYHYLITYVDDDGETKEKTVTARHEFEAHQLAGTSNKFIISIVNQDL